MTYAERLREIADELEDAAWSPEFNSKWLIGKADEIRSIADQIGD